jgi:hypothetical protein
MRKQLTGEPVAGELHTGFGGRGRRQPFPTPIPWPNCDSSQGYWHDRKIPQFAGGFDGGGANPIELRRSAALGRDFTRDDQKHAQPDAIAR